MSALTFSDYKTASNFLEEMEVRRWAMSGPGMPAIYHKAKTQEALFRGDIDQAAYHSRTGDEIMSEAGDRV